MGLVRVFNWLFSTPPRRVTKRSVPLRKQRRQAPATVPPAREAKQARRNERARHTAAICADARRNGQTILKGRAYVVDGDTIIINKVNIRLAGIDAPELDHPWGQKSKWAVVAMTKGQTVTAHVTQEMSYDRVVATCTLPNGKDIAAELVKQGLAIDWPKYSGGKYTSLEPSGIRKKLWRADARQKGRWPC